MPIKTGFCASSVCISLLKHALKLKRHTVDLLLHIARYIIPKVCAVCNNNRSAVGLCLFNFSACFSNEIQTDDAQKPVFIGTILHCTYSFGGFAPRHPPGLCPWSPLGDFRPPDLLLSHYTPCHYILDKGLKQCQRSTPQSECYQPLMCHQTTPEQCISLPHNCSHVYSALMCTYNSGYRILLYWCLNCGIMIT